VVEVCGGEWLQRSVRRSAYRVSRGGCLAKRSEDAQEVIRPQLVPMVSFGHWNKLMPIRSFPLGMMTPMSGTPPVQG
jgi:hypothetical protein